MDLKIDFVDEDKIEEEKEILKEEKIEPVKLEVQDSTCSSKTKIGK